MIVAWDKFWQPRYQYFIRVCGRLKLNKFVTVVFVCLLSLPGISSAQQAKLFCSQIADPNERLACFDRTFPTRAPSVSAPAASAPAADEPGPQTDAPLGSTSISPEKSATLSSAPTSTTNASVPREKSLFSRGRLFSDKTVNISSRLMAIRDKGQQKMVFRLENDQIWMQNSARSLPFHEGDKVSIKSGTMGGYILSNGSGLSTRVRQIK